MWNEKYIFVGGKGGVGKSTSATAIAVKHANAGQKTLLVSTDPAHNIGDIFQILIGGKIKKVDSSLYALEIDPEIETTRYIQTVKEHIKGVVNAKMMEEVHRQLDAAKTSPGADEAALFDRLITILLEESGNFDKIVIDTAPTGHTIRLLSLPTLMGVWMQGLIDRRKATNDKYSRLIYDGEPVEDPIYDALRTRQSRFERARSILLDDTRTAYVFVLNAERLPIIETEKAMRLLQHYEMDVSTLIVNKVLPQEVTGAFMEERKKHEAQYVKQIYETFKKQSIYAVPLFSKDITSKAQLLAVSHYLRKE